MMMFDVVPPVVEWSSRFHVARPRFGNVLRPRRFELFECDFSCVARARAARGELSQVE